MKQNFDQSSTSFYLFYGAVTLLLFAHSIIHQSPSHLTQAPSLYLQIAPPLI